MTQGLKDIQCYTDFSSKDFECKNIDHFIYWSFCFFSIDEQNENEKPLHELLSLEGVPTYFILNFSGK